MKTALLLLLTVLFPFFGCVKHKPMKSTKPLMDQRIEAEFHDAMKHAVSWASVATDPNLKTCFTVDGIDVYVDQTTACPSKAMVSSSVDTDLAFLKKTLGKAPNVKVLNGFVLIYTNNLLTDESGLLYLGISPFCMRTSIITTNVPSLEASASDQFATTKHELLHDLLYEIGYPNELNGEHMPQEWWDAVEKDDHL